MLNYQIMVNTDNNGKYLPDYDELIKNASCIEEAEKWQEAKSRGTSFAFNMVVCLKQTCGHWEIFQSPVNEYHRLTDELQMLVDHSRESKCTRCICGW